MAKKKNETKAEKPGDKETITSDNKHIKKENNNIADKETEGSSSSGKSNGEEHSGKDNTKGSTVSVTPEEKLSEVTDKYVRLSAEFDNYRKRTLRERIEFSKSAGEELLRKILPVMDDFERALKVMENASDCKAMKDGIDLIYNKFGEFLKQNGVKEIEALGKNFDVDIHEAITKIPAKDASQKGKVVDVVEKGYFLHDKIMRFPKVVVGD